MSINTITMAQPANRPKELNLNRPDTFDGNREGFKKFLQDVKIYMDVNHKTYNNDLRKIAFILSFIMTGAAATWKAQFIKEAYTKPIPTNPNDRLRMYATFRKELIEAFSMFDSVGDTLGELQSLLRFLPSSLLYIYFFIIFSLHYLISLIPGHESPYL
jgi:Domain of unknown function (DUF4939)